MDQKARLSFHIKQIKKLIGAQTINEKHTQQKQKTLSDSKKISVFRDDHVFLVRNSLVSNRILYELYYCYYYSMKTEKNRSRE